MNCFLERFPPRFFIVKLVCFIGFLGSSYLVLFIILLCMILTYYWCLFVWTRFINNKINNLHLKLVNSINRCLNFSIYIYIYEQLEVKTTISLKEKNNHHRFKKEKGKSTIWLKEKKHFKRKRKKGTWIRTTLSTQPQWREGKFSIFSSTTLLSTFSPKINPNLGEKILVVPRRKYLHP